MADVTFTENAINAATHEQIEAIKGLISNEHDVHVTKSAPWDLPEGYLAFRSTHLRSNSVVYGGIAPDGQVST